MSTREHPLIGSVIERTAPRTLSAPSSRFSSRSPGTGFPTAQHRFKSAFARARDEANLRSSGASKQQQAHPSPPTVAMADPNPIPTDTDALLRHIRQENAQAIACMSDKEIEQEKQAILEQLGDGTAQLLKRVQEARRRKEEKEKETSAQMELEDHTTQEVPGKDECMTKDSDATTNHSHAPLVLPAPRYLPSALASKPGILRVKSLENMGRSAPSPLPATSSTRPSSRTGRKLRFAEVTPDDVHVYESAPVSPKRAVLALPPPPDTKDDSIVSLGTYRKDTIKPKARQFQSTDIPVPRCGNEPAEGTPEYIRQRYFPDVPPNDPSVAWMETSCPDGTDVSAPRFDFHGAPIPSSLSASLPSHLGLHHHAEGSHAGYTIDDIFLLARSTVPAQRASMLGILAKIAHRLGLQVRGLDNTDKYVFPGQEEELRKRILSSGLAAIGQIGSLGAQAVEIVWECLVGWDGRASEVEGIELDLAPDVVSSLRLEYFLPQITDVLSHAALPSESLAQLLSVVHWLAQSSNQVADMITNTPRLVPTILNTFLLTPIPPKEGSPSPNPLALQLLITLASASRSSASALLDPAETLLRFVTLLPSSSPYPSGLAFTLLTHTLWFYSTLASYGLYSHIAITASQIFTTLSSYIHTILPSSPNVSSSEAMELRLAWVTLVEAWTVCATDPHATSPPHGILWSQVCALGWSIDVRQFRDRLGSETSTWALYAAIWNAEAAWLEGARINSIKSGEQEREEALRILGSAFAAKDGPDFSIVWCALESVQCNLRETDSITPEAGECLLRSLAIAGNVLASALRLWLACIPPIDNGIPVSAPPFALPLSELSASSAALAKHSIWSLPSKLGAAHLHTYLQPLSYFLSHFHRVSRHIPGTTPQLWFAQGLVFLSRLRRGDESYALSMLETLSFVRPQLVGIGPEGPLQDIQMDALQPFFEYAVRPDEEEYVAPLRPNTESILRASTLRLPASANVDANANTVTRMFAAGLPLTRDFLFTPLAHLLRSGTSPVFRALPNGWTASEVDVVRATLFLVYTARRVLIAHELDEFVPNAAEVVFGCMRVCMLEHGVGVGTGRMGMETEVFRDAGVERLMGWLLEPFTIRGGVRRTTTQTSTLEDASTPYLGSTPFYQFYTDLVALYGAVSFGHSIFAALLVAPLAMQYAVDYRQALWCSGAGEGAGSNSTSGPGGGGLGDVVRSVRISIEDVICTASEGKDPREYLYPVERDIGVLGAYAAALIARDGSGTDGFLRLVAVHHVACTVWMDLDPGAVVDAGKDEEETTKQAETETKRREEIRARLLRMVLTRGEADAVRDVVLYHQRPWSCGAFVWPPMCYCGGGDEDKDTAAWREERLAFVRRVMWHGEAERVAAWLMHTSRT